jgi:hypothetical protein
VIKDVVPTQNARCRELRTELGEIADEFSQNLHIEMTRGPPPVKIELAEEADPDETVGSVPA